MDEQTKNQLLALNQSFYEQFADAFASSRENPHPGFTNLLQLIPQSFDNVLDVGCGNGRFGQFLNRHHINFDYVGVDFTSELLQKADENICGTFVKKDISQAGFLEDLGQFDVVVCLSTMQHIPGRSDRVRLLSEMGEHLANSASVLILANWQFMDSQRQRRKIQKWEQIGLTSQEVEPGDYLLSWQRDGFGLRYVCMIDAQETASLADEAGLSIKHQFRSDGKEGNLNLYTILSR